jgi:hypothetical protein
VNDDERNALRNLLTQTQEILGWVIHDSDSAVPAYLRPPLKASWLVTENGFASLDEAIASRNMDAELDDHGLSGPELQVKLTAFRAYYESWSELRDKRQRGRSRGHDNVEQSGPPVAR